MHFPLFRLGIRVAAALLTFAVVAGVTAATPITHSFLATGANTRIVAADGKIIWTYPASTRDGSVLPNGNILLAVSKNKEYPAGAVVELTRDNKKIFEFKGTQSEVNTAQALPNGNILLTEAGDKPRILEVTRAGKIFCEVPMTAQTTNHHMQSRMARKLANGNYLVPQLYDKVVREYDPAGKIVRDFKTPEFPTNACPFTAIRLPDGNTFITCTRSHLIIEVDATGKIVWRLTNADLPTPIINDACGAQRLPNGNTVICSYLIGDQRTKLFEITRDKKIVWTYTDDAKAGIHEVQILDTNGKLIDGAPLR